MGNQLIKENMFSLSKILIALFSASTVLTGVKASVFSAIGIPEPPNKAYYRGTTPNIIAIVEMFKKRTIFFGSDKFWISFMTNLQVDTSNDTSDCVTEMDIYLTLWRDT